MVLATAVTYLGNRTLTWRRDSGSGRGREVVPFLVPHHALGLTSRLADNISANVIGVGLGTVFRFVTYKYVVFGSDRSRGRGLVRGVGLAEPRPA